MLISTIADYVERFVSVEITPMNDSEVTDITMFDDGAVGFRPEQQ